ncbi:SDR family NAD(P)-dependent oxidoreductase [Paraburkholderia elongata]|uniref:SDR family NAD(P)-dependent oxidoreductase n=1 Tax=Paraburkholderia elongata TaxID=2675747 RepID=UPI001C131678|nr:SDR family NAD(P)-dependent oxidoreductase [Paraburkholderia elongata]
MPVVRHEIGKVGKGDAGIQQRRHDAAILDGNGVALYSISKAAVVRMTEALAVEWAKFGINVNAIAPGMFESEMMGEMLQRVGDVTDRFPRRRMGDP